MTAGVPGWRRARSGVRPRRGVDASLLTCQCLPRSRVDLLCRLFLLCRHGMRLGAHRDRNHPKAGGVAETLE